MGFRSKQGYEPQILSVSAGSLRLFFFNLIAIGYAILSVVHHTLVAVFNTKSTSQIIDLPKVG